MSALNNIGHAGNFSSSEDDSSSSGGGQNLYGDMFGIKGVFSSVEAVQNVEQTFSGWLTGGHNVTMLTFGLGSIFSMQSPMDLKSASLFKFLDLASPVSGFSLPKVIGLGTGGRGK